MKLKKDAAEKSDHERKMKRKEKLERCTNFFSSSLLEPVYSKGKTISSDEQGKKNKGGEINSNNKAKNKETTSSSSRGDKNSKEKNKETNSSHGEKRKNNISSNTGNKKMNVNRKN